MRNVTSMIKSKGFNQIRKVLKPNGKFGAPSVLTTEEQMALITNIVNQISLEIRSYKVERKQKRKIEQERVARGYKSKKKTSKAEYELMKQNKVA